MCAEAFVASTKKQAAFNCVLCTLCQAIRKNKTLFTKKHEPNNRSLSISRTVNTNVHQK